MAQKNSIAYVDAHPARLTAVKDFKELSEQLGSSFGKFLAYLLYTNLALSVNNAYVSDPEGEFELNAQRNNRARDKEKIEGQFVLRPEFDQPLADMLAAAEKVMTQDVRPFEYSYLVMFKALIYSFKSGELYPAEVEIIFNAA